MSTFESIKPGLYFHEKKGFGFVTKLDERSWEFDTNKMQKHSIFNLRVPIIACGVGPYYLEKVLKGYELIDADFVIKEVEDD